MKIISDEAFVTWLNLQSLTLPSTIESVGEHIVSTSIELTLESSSYFTFTDNVLVEKSTKTAVLGTDGCKIPSDIKKIANYAFYKVQISSFSLPTTLTTIGDRAFNNAELPSSTTVKLTSNITSVGRYAFYGATGIDVIRIATEGEIDSCAFDEITFTSLIYDNKPNVTGTYALLAFTNKSFSYYYEKESMPETTTMTQLTSDMEGYRKYQAW